MGVRMLRGALSRTPVGLSRKSVAPGGELATLRAGLLTNLANAKAVVYFGSVFSAFLGSRMDAVTRWGLWVLVVAETFAWFALVAAVFALPSMRRGYLRLARWIDGFAGAVFVAFGLHLLFARRS
jgi:threonine efflux protein